MGVCVRTVYFFVSMPFLANACPGLGIDNYPSLESVGVGGNSRVLVVWPDQPDTTASEITPELVSDFSPTSDSVIGGDEDLIDEREISQNSNNRALNRR